MFLSSIYGLVILSDIDLPELNSVDASSASGRYKNSDIAFRVQRSPAQIKHFPKTLNPLWKSPTGHEWLRYSKDGANYILEFPDLVYYSINQLDNTIIYSADTSIPAVTIRHLLLDHIFPLVLSLSGQIVLHAAVIAVEQKAAVLLGRSGSGKSTLAASFHQAGNSVLTDDSVLVSKKDDNGYQCHSNYPGIRLFSDSKNAVVGQDNPAQQMAHYTSKLRVKPEEDSFYHGHVNIETFYKLAYTSEGDDITIVDLPFDAALMSLVESTFRLDIKSKEKLTTELDWLTELCIATPCKEIRYARKFDLLPQVRDKIIADVLSA